MGDGLVGGLREIGAAGGQRDGSTIRRGQDLGRGDVLGQLDVRRAGLLQRRDAEGLANDLGDRGHPFNARVPFRDGLEHAHDVDDLVRLLVELLGRGLAGQRDHRGTVQVRVGDAGQEVRRARPERAHGDGDAAGEPAVDVGHERRALLVPRRDVADLRPSRQRIEDVHRLLARNGEDVLASLGGEAVHDEIGGAAGRTVGTHRASIVHPGLVVLGGLRRGGPETADRAYPVSGSAATVIPMVRPCASPRSMADR